MSTALVVGVGFLVWLALALWYALLLGPVLKDERHNVTERGQMTPDWREKYEATEKQLVELIAATERG